MLDPILGAEKREGSGRHDKVTNMQVISRFARTVASLPAYREEEEGEGKTGACPHSYTTLLWNKRNVSYNLLGFLIHSPASRFSASLQSPAALARATARPSPIKGGPALAGQLSQSSASTGCTRVRAHANRPSRLYFNFGESHRERETIERADRDPGMGRAGPARFRLASIDASTFVIPGVYR